MIMIPPLHTTTVERAETLDFEATLREIRSEPDRCCQGDDPYPYFCGVLKAAHGEITRAARSLLDDLNREKQRADAMEYALEAALEDDTCQMIYTAADAIQQAAARGLSDRELREYVNTLQHPTCDKFRWSKSLAK